jgi:hypothetical protein
MHFAVVGGLDVDTGELEPSAGSGSRQPAKPTTRQLTSTMARRAVLSLTYADQQDPVVHFAGQAQFSEHARIFSLHAVLIRQVEPRIQVSESAEYGDIVQLIILVQCLVDVDFDAKAGRHGGEPYREQGTRPGCAIQHSPPPVAWSRIIYGAEIETNRAVAIGGSSQYFSDVPLVCHR